MTQSKLNLSNWHLAEVTTGSKGQRTCQLTSDHKPVSFHLGSCLRTRFGASSYDRNIDSTRKSLDFEITNDQQITSMLQEIDNWAMQYVFDNGGKILKKVMSKDVIKENYKPLLSTYGDSVRVKTKINTGGHRICQCWDVNRNPCDIPEDWLENEYDVQVAVPQLWIMGSTFGLTLETTNLLIRPIQSNCPF